MPDGAVNRHCNDALTRAAALLGEGVLVHDAPAHAAREPFGPAWLDRLRDALDVALPHRPARGADGRRYREGDGTQTCAEFVGDDETVELLRELGVDDGQGFHLGRPRPLDDLLREVRR
ncbi:MAG: hypothetical protein ACSLFR_08030 [Solirubrobacteraceae bacterium]